MSLDGPVAHLVAQSPGVRRRARRRSLSRDSSELGGERGLPVAVPHLSRRSRSPTEAWVAALTSPDPRVPGDASALAVLAARIDRWIRPADDELEATGFRTCFRLRPPVREDDADPEPAPVSATIPRPSRKKRKAAAVPEDVWRIDFLLQARDDPSLLIEPEAIWSTPGARLAALGARRPAAAGEAARRPRQGETRRSVSYWRRDES